IPGPTIEATAGQRVIVHFTNRLSEPTTVHWHGLRIPSDMDGTPRVQEPVPQGGGTFTYDFVVPEAGTFWYHPHVRTNEQMERGLYGAFVVREAEEPLYDAERVVVLDDLLFDFDTGRLPPFLAAHGEIMHGRSGNVLLTNGRLSGATSYAAEQGTVERWRLVNSANARTMELTVTGASLRIIGTDGGLLAEPYTTDRLVMPVGQRYDFEISYDAPGTVELLSHVLTLDDAGEVVEVSIPVYSVEVAETAWTPRAVELPAIAALPSRPIDSEALISFDGATDALGNLVWTLNGQAAPADPLFTFTEGEAVLITLQNLAGPEHPFHLHGQFFEILSGGEPSTSQPGLKDTVLLPGNSTVQIRAYLDNPGRWMAHCHILEHAELGMMAEITVDPR
ncbi:MAG: multicopper oxidase family protein, partial [Myxococcales bacterium]|nr:multicopper oxidase family protein [Myxococcales bacterium]